MTVVPGAAGTEMRDSTGTSMFKGVLLGFASFAAYAISDAFVKSLRGGVPAYEAVFIGALLGLAALPLVKGRGESWRDAVTARRPGLWWVRAVTGAICNISSVTAFTLLPMAEVFALIFLMPIFVTLLSVLFLKEHVGWRRWSAVVAGFVGVLVVLRPGFRHLGLGHAAAIACGLSGAVSVIALRLAGPHEKRVSLYGAGMVGPLIVGGLLMLPGFVWPDLRQWWLLAGYGLLAALAAVLLMYATLLAHANRVAPTQYSQMLWAIGFGYWLFGDRLDWPMLAGIALILGAGIFTLVREEKVTPWWRRAKMI
ncbi:S-adenosylmethionine uptake transporter [Fulvimonas soli]|uniref:S-adenosylmethionine uptake transporter n=2 Tax=Fulvimonas soli TaxID=155197 RepID=A0A316IIY3_9GAMM|nr:S-adenosylmethionine uptake transporter [Fulvimonas soli]